MIIGAPTQHSSPRNLKTATNLYTQHGLKFPQLAYFYSAPEFIFAGLMEGSHRVNHYIPQPFDFSLPRQPHYIPDFFVSYTDGSSVVYEIRSQGIMDKKKLAYCQELCLRNDMTFELLTNAEVLEQAINGTNAWRMVRHLLRWQNEDSLSLQRQIQRAVKIVKNTTIREIQFQFNDYTSGHVLKALYTLMINHVLGGDWEKQPLSKRTQLWLTT
jgi:hypothetical protein